MPTYLSPGVYVEEVPSAVQPIAGVSTSTAGFIGVISDDKITIPTSPVIQIKDEKITEPKSGSDKIFKLKYYPVNTDMFEILVNNKPDKSARLSNDNKNKISYVELTDAPAIDPPATKPNIQGNYILLANQVTNELIGKGNGTKDTFELKKYPVREQKDESQFSFDGTAQDQAKISSLKNDLEKGVATVQFTPAPGKVTITGNYRVDFPFFFPVKEKEVKLCTSFAEFKKFFGDFSDDKKQRNLAHAVYGFFNNGGSRCYVMRVKQEDDITVETLEAFEAIDEIAIVVAPGITNSVVRSAIVTHCQQKTGDRFSIFYCK